MLPSLYEFEDRNDQQLFFCFLFNVGQGMINVSKLVLILRGMR